MQESTAPFGESPKAKTNLPAPCARILLNQNAIGPKVINTIVHMKNLLQVKGIFEDEIEEIVLSDNDSRWRELPDTIKKEDMPIIFIQDVCIGTVSDLEDWIVSEKLDSLLERVYMLQRSRSNSANATAFAQRIEDVKFQKQLIEDELAKAQSQNDTEAAEELKYSILVLDRDLHSMTKLYEERQYQSTSTAQSQPQSRRDSLLFETTSTSSAGIVDKAVETGRWWFKGMGTALSSMGTYLPWNGANDASAVLSTSPPKEYKDDKGTNFVEYEVMQINWYWRQQKRILRFSKDRFLRLNPFTKEVRAVHYYRTVKDIVVTGKTFMTISFNDNYPAEYYQSVDLDKIINSLVERASPTVIPISYVKE